MTHPMSIPKYDAWRLQGPDERPDPETEACDNCAGVGVVVNNYGFVQDCEECGGTGGVEVTPGEPDGDYEYERKRDAMEDRG